MEIKEYVRPSSLDEAYQLMRTRHATPLGGCVWLRMNAKPVALGVDLAALDLDYIRDAGDMIEIGAMTTYRSLETSTLLAEQYGKLFPEALGHIVGVQLRATISVGGTVAGRYGFSDLNTTLSALGAKVVLYPGTIMDLATFIAEGAESPFLVEKILLPKGVRGAYQQIRITRNDFPILNVAVAWTGSSWRVAVGSRPAATRLCHAAMQMLGSDPNPSDQTIEAASRQAAEETSVGSDIRASHDYRKAVLPVLIRRALLEVRG
ncbi:MAG: FAD binding domain-containing protein [Spirochaetales bacterium]|nr:FAD binding domain-containing protein [Spirochaetales bacterium]